MIDVTLKFLKDEIAAYLKLMTNEDDVLELSNMTNEKGEIIIKKLGMSLVSVEEDKIAKSHNFYQRTPQDELLKGNPEVKLNLYIIFTANFGENNYDEALKFLSHIIGFFQAKSFFDSTNSPLLPAKVNKLIIDLHTLSFEQQNHLWGFVGGKYFPSVLYKLRMIVIDENKYSEVSQPIYTVNTNLINS